MEDTRLIMLINLSCRKRWKELISNSFASAFVTLFCVRVENVLNFTFHWFLFFGEISFFTLGRGSINKHSLKASLMKWLQRMGKGWWGVFFRVKGGEPREHTKVKNEVAENFYWSSLYILLLKWLPDGSLTTYKQIG